MTKIKKDKHLQEFKLFLKDKEVSQYVKNYIKSRERNPKIVKIELLKLEKNVSRAYGKALKKNKAHFFKAIKDSTYQKAIKKRDNFLKTIEKSDPKVSWNDIEHILEVFNKPISWRIPLNHYIMTGEITSPSVRCEVYMKNDRVIVEVSPEANADDYREAYKSVEIMQKFLRGYDIKKKRQKSKFDEKQRILEALEKHNNPYDVIDEVYGNDGTIETIRDKDNKRRAVIRQTKHRYKR